MDVSASLQEGAERRELPTMEVAAVLAATALALATKSHLALKSHLWADRVERNKCPWCQELIEYPGTGIPEWQCCVRPKRHNADRKTRYFLI